MDVGPTKWSWHSYFLGMCIIPFNHLSFVYVLFKKYKYYNYINIIKTIGISFFFLLEYSGAFSTHIQRRMITVFLGMNRSRGTMLF